MEANQIRELVNWKGWWDVRFGLDPIQIGEWVMRAAGGWGVGRGCGRECAASSNP